MRSYSIVIGLIAFIVFVSSVLYADVFHGRDKETGTIISRTAVDTVTPEKGLSIGLKIIRVHKTNKVTLAFTSSDKRLKDLDTSSASLLVDDRSIPLTFKGYHVLPLPLGLPPIHELWFAELNSSLLAKLLQCKTMSLVISTVSGIPIKRTLRPDALSDVKEVLSGSRSEATKSVEPNRSVTQQYQLDDIAQERKTERVKSPQKGMMLVTLDTTYFKKKGGQKCRSFKPDYSRYHTIIHLAANIPIGKTKKNGKEYNVYAAIIEGKDLVSGKRRGVGFSADMSSLFLSGNPIMKMNMRVGEPGTRITFEGNENDPFEPIPGLRIWDGAIDIDPECGLMIHAKSAK